MRRRWCWRRRVKGKQGRTKRFQMENTAEKRRSKPLLLPPCFHVSNYRVSAKPCVGTQVVLSLSLPLFLSQDDWMNKMGVSLSSPPLLSTTSPSSHPVLFLHPCLPLPPSFSTYFSTFFATAATAATTTKYYILFVGLSRPFSLPPSLPPSISFFFFYSQMIPPSNPQQPTPRFPSSWRLLGKRRPRRSRRRERALACPCARNRRPTAGVVGGRGGGRGGGEEGVLLGGRAGAFGPGTGAEPDGEAEDEDEEDEEDHDLGEREGGREGGREVYEWTCLWKRRWAAR